VDTFELAEEKQTSLFTTENTQRVERQKESPIFVIIGNPPYNAGQINENDNSKNRKYPVIDQKVYETYAKDSKATLVNQLSDPYVKAIRFASDRIGDEGIVAFVTNNSFIDGIAFDGMRKHLEGDFDKIYHINLKGNARTSGERRRKEAGNIFDDMIRVSVGITFFIKNKNISKEEIEFYIYSIDDYLKSRQKKEFLIDKQSFVNVNFEKRVPTKNHIWLNKGIREDFEDFIPIGSKKAKRAKKKEEIQTIFKIYGRGVCSNGDAYVYNFNEEKLKDIAKGMVEDYNSQRDRWIREGQPKDLRNFLDIDEKVLKWIRHTKRSLKRGLEATFDEEKIRTAIYRPFCKKYYYFERIFNEDLYRIPKFFPTSESEKYNRVICVKSRGMSKPFHALMVSCIPDVQFTPNGQCFPFYVYDDAGNATENITDWCLEQFRDHYGVGVDLCVNPNNTKGEHTGSPLREITKWDIFYYVYALLHHPFYRKRYAANLKRELPRIPFASNFFEFAEIGQKLAALHIGYEDADEYPLDMIENPDEPLDWRVEKMRIRNKPKKYSRRKSRKKGKSQKPSKPAHIIYNVFLTLGGIPPETFDYRLGNRSALEWIVDRYRIKTDKRSGITNDPNRDDDPQYIVRLIKKIVTVSLETVELVEMLAEFNIEEGETTK
jgi:predicted helicase